MAKIKIDEPMTRLSPYQLSCLAYIEGHPGCSVADVDRACHRPSRRSIERLVQRGVVICEQSVTDRTWALYALHEAPPVDPRGY